MVAEMIGPLIGVQETPFLLPSTAEVGLFWVMPATAVTSFFELKGVAKRKISGSYIYIYICNHYGRYTNDFLPHTLECLLHHKQVDV